MAEEFSKAVEEGLRLSKRIYFGRDRAVSPPKPPPSMLKSSTAFLPTAPMLYAVIHDPGIVDNPDVPSYQPHVHGRCDPPALIPLHMSAIDLNAHCYFDTVFVTVSATWRLHCVTGCRSCDCRIAIPMGGKQGSIQGVEVRVHRKSYSTQLVDIEDTSDKESAIRAQNGGFLKPNIFTLNIPQIDGGSNLSVKITWSQKVLYYDDTFSLNVPFTFPDFVNPAGKRMLRKEKIQIDVNADAGSELLCKAISHPLKEVKRSAGSMSFSIDSEVISWSKVDFNFSYAVSSSHIHGGVLLKSPSEDDFDQREMFCMYLSPGNLQSRKVFRKDIIFVIDISGSMRGKLIDDTKNALSTALNRLDRDDSFSIIAFNGESYLFSTSMELASKDAVQRAIEWINMNFVAGGDTNILHPLKTAMEMLSSARSSIPIIFLVTDGSVEDERQICDMVKNHVTNAESIPPRIYTFGIDLVEPQMLRLFDKASSLLLANITMDIFDDLDEVEVYPSLIPELSSDVPLTLSGRYKGRFPEFLKVKGVLADFSSFVIDMKIQEANDMPVQRVAKLSLQTGFMSEYTSIAILEDDQLKKEMSKKTKPRKGENAQGQRMIMLPSLGIGFGNLIATAENTPPGWEETRGPDGAEMFVKAATNCCGSMCHYCCCMCCIQCCTRMNNQCATALTQLCVGIGCLGCLSCCSDMCCAESEN
ncbi:unnamed protein product [Lupinus luteus]|uniref:VWFA domain-containing protein n=1 Tax=Lupinus luteus TaxID=3873 RepID=A0AAV1XGG8_LUPLU